MAKPTPKSEVIAFNQPATDSPAPNHGDMPYLPPQGMSRASQILPFLPFGSTTLWKWSKDGRFPAPVKLSPTISAWRNAEVLAWLESHTASEA